MSLQSQKDYWAKEAKAEKAKSDFDKAIEKAVKRQLAPLVKRIQALEAAVGEKG